MGEQANKIGKKLEGFGEKLFTGFGWTELARDTEIQCSRKHNHSKQTHGLDLFMRFDNPYLGSKQGVIIECKNRQMKSITQAEIDKWLVELINSIECSQSAQELEHIDTEGTNLNTGLLLIHANDSFNDDNFSKYLSNLKVPNRRNPINVFIAGNAEINRWNSLRDKIEKDYSKEFCFIYPSIEGSNMELGSYITINQLYSKYIFAQDVVHIQKDEDGLSYPVPMVRKIMISFDDITMCNFKYMWSMFKAFQFQDAKELVFMFYPRKIDDVEYVKENFIKTLYQANPSITKEIEKKIKIDFIDNRNLSPVDAGGR
ncbi:hypothetical protein SAMN02746066_01462 [Anaerosporobacter mobilis DSM 15930]|jgi:hypothetical protein|uniref:GAPS4 PD-(D/E)XK nuclease domain-containing protein n=1 Tax=Anaerosporobacter mobilis DSM 15930 TaxID=1120996 RepID=A0A1M7HNR3_9FIRM|nr:hypothetical protein [Anaerosporobacter mobilis]SHM29757.1 hypothetical protein SAMN02746066_01462 [Anaerosporobacter mobilis DSM 15930]